MQQLKPLDPNGTPPPENTTTKTPKTRPKAKSQNPPKPEAPKKRKEETKARNRRDRKPDHNSKQRRQRGKPKQNTREQETQKAGRAKHQEGIPHLVPLNESFVTPTRVGQAGNGRPHIGDDVVPPQSIKQDTKYTAEAGPMRDGGPSDGKHWVQAETSGNR